MTEPLVLPLDTALDDPAHARQFVRDHLDRVPSSVCEDALVLTSELVTNVVRHGRLPARLELQVADGAIRVEVFDSGPGVPATPAGGPQPTQGSGRGLLIVAALAREWGVHTRPGVAGKSVWFALPTG